MGDKEDHLVNLLHRAKDNDHLAIIEILKLFEPKLKKSLHQVPPQDRDDLSQSIKLKIIEVIKNYPIKINDDK